MDLDLIKSTENAIAQMETLIQLSNHHIVVDIDIKGFFDNVNHSKLLKQIWTLGIRDKKLICIISAMLKAEIKGSWHTRKRYATRWNFISSTL